MRKGLLRLPTAISIFRAILIVLLIGSASISFAQEKPNLGKGKQTAKPTATDTIISPKPIIGKGKSTTAQSEPTTIESETTPVVKEKASKSEKEKREKTIKLFDRNVKKAPLKAVLLSAVVPGAGQAFNRRYWKIPIVWGALGTAGYFIGSNSRYYKNFRKAYLYRVDGDPNTVDPYEGIYLENDLEALRESYQKNMEVSYAAFFALYFLTGVDAFVDAHLSSFDISDDLSIRVGPRLMQSPVAGDRAAFGVGISVFGRNNTETPIDLF